MDQCLRYEEFETICGTWCGSVLYRKIIRLGSLPDTAIKNVPHGLKNITVVKIYGFIGNGTGVSLTLPLSDIRLIGNVKLYADGINVTIETGTDRTSFNGTAIIEYVKN